LAKKKSKNSFEDDLQRLEEISSTLESESIGLDDSMSLYEEGIKLSKNCLQTLKKAELKITELRNELGKIAEESETELPDK
jgi:exodeoxyribonuclease VII small subunit